MQPNTKKVIDTLVGLIANATHTDDALAASAAIENALKLDAPAPVAPSAPESAPTNSNPSIGSFIGL
jgi:hypothetical protein